ncbi:response regulator [Phormidesmis priestleyi ULC007]|uniref:Response regulator n=1 Tax=Phormidesmis priestleyi ULC007 TaxID=1920490 RepID=A0A2T1DGQ0_9CYAN|nr:response regulator [Phormidesmis priestleyi]PSB19656.1 response regulator [Phormidesmis priestleyi ULC007]PZO53540.1 MAG: response regulator [Phormidesmis priestleyi]
MNQLRLMVISDDPVATSIDRMLHTPEVEIVVAGSVNESLEAFGLRQPDVLICDVDLLDDERCLQMRSLRALEINRGWNATPAILVSGSIKDLDFNQAIAMGFRRFLARPIERDRLMSAITSLISLSN